MSLNTRIAKLETEAQRRYDAARDRIFAHLDVDDLAALAGPMVGLSTPELQAIANGWAEYTGPPISPASVKPTIRVLSKMYDLATPDERAVLADVWAWRAELEAL